MPVSRTNAGIMTRSVSLPRLKFFFFPINRPTLISRTRSSSPCFYPEKMCCRRRPATAYMNIREQLRPYVREQMQLAHEKGTPVMRPLFYDFPEDRPQSRSADSGCRADASPDRSRHRQTTARTACGTPDLSSPLRGSRRYPPCSENFREMMEKGYLVRTEHGVRISMTCFGQELFFDATNPEATAQADRTRLTGASSPSAVIPS